MKIQIWQKSEWEKNLKDRLETAKNNRKKFERKFLEWGHVAYGLGQDYQQVTLSYENLTQLAVDDIDAGDADIQTNNIIRYLRLLHALNLINPPSVVPRPTGSDFKERRASDAADKLIRYSIRNKNFTDLFAKFTWSAMIRGTAFIKSVWDGNRGDVTDFDESTGEVTTEGDSLFYVPSIFDMYIDPIARSWDDVRYTFERIQLPLDEAKAMFPDDIETIESSLEDVDTDKFLQDNKRKNLTVTFYEYYEKGAPINGGIGRHAFITSTGKIVGEYGENNHVNHWLPYHILTDIDIEDDIYGISTIEYVQRQQDLLNDFDSAMIESVKAHGTIRMAMHSNAGLDEDALSNSPWDIILYEGDPSAKPHFVSPGALPPDMIRLRQQFALDIQEGFGVNDSMMGVQKREQSGFSQQTAMEAGNTQRRRFYDKLALATESVHRHNLEMIKEHWKTKKTISVVGNEKALIVADFSGADIKNGFDIIVEHGQSLPLDPNLRKEQIMALQPLLEKAGFDSKTIVKLLKLSDLDSMYDLNTLSEERQYEIFQKMWATYEELGEPEYIPPKEYEAHAEYLAFAEKYLNTLEFKSLPKDVKDLIVRHVEERTQMAAEVASPPQPGMPPLAPPAPAAGGMPPIM